MSLTFIDLFAGIGGFRLGMEQAGHKCIGYVEWDKFARKSYEAINNTKGEWTEHDINKVKPGTIPAADVWCFGFPCTDISISGPQKGLAGARSGLFYKTIKLLKSQKEEDKPKYLFIENVKNLFSVNGGWDFARVLISMDEAGYDAEWELLNSKDFGVPQNRERVFIIGHLRGSGGREVFPIGRKNETSIEIAGYLSEGYKDVNYVLNPKGIAKCLLTMGGGNREPKVLVKGNINPSGNGMNGNVYESEGLAPTLTTNKGEGPKVLVKEATKEGYAIAEIGDSINLSNPSSKTRRGRVGKGITQTLDTSCNQATIESKPPYRIRKLTPRECWRLQGFPDWAFDRAQEVNSNSQLYKQSGNSVTVPVIYEIAKRLV